MVDASTFTAYPLVEDAPLLVPAPRQRYWHEHTRTTSPNRCLPLSIANQLGWWVLNPCEFTARADESGYVHVDYPAGAPTVKAKHHFGGGILTIDLPFLWRTAPGYDLLVRGPANQPLPGAYPLEGVLEADWADIPVPINWQLEPRWPVTFLEGMPVAQVLPVRRGELERFDPTVVAPPEGVVESYRAYHTSRHAAYVDEIRDPSQRLDGYFVGCRADGSRGVPDHRRRLRLRPFRRAGVVV